MSSEVTGSFFSFFFLFFNETCLFFSLRDEGMNRSFRSVFTQNWEAFLAFHGTDFNRLLHFIYKPVILFAVLIKWLASLWNATLDWNKVTFFQIFSLESRLLISIFYLSTNGFIRLDDHKINVLRIVISSGVIAKI